MSVLTAYDKFIQQALKYAFSLWGTPKTGQTITSRTGDDGHFEKGYPKAGPKFLDNGDGTISDLRTGLMWVKDPSECGGNFGTPGSPSKMVWSMAIDDCLSLVYAGHSDWRLPNVKELQSIVDYGKAAPTINAIFTNAQSDNHWTSTTLVTADAAGWFITFNTGVVFNFSKGSSCYVRPVRLGQ